MFFTRLTSWESASTIIARRRNISPTLTLSPLSSSRSLFLSSLGNKFKTKVQLKTSLEVVLSELKIWDFHHYVQETVLFLQNHSQRCIRVNTVSSNNVHIVRSHLLTSSIAPTFFRLVVCPRLKLENVGAMYI